MFSTPCRHRSAAARAASSAAVVALLCASGCTTARYAAARLPTHLQAPAVESPQSIDLSRLASVPGGLDQIDRGDLLDVTVSAGLNSADTFTVAARVSEEGTANLPLIGDVPLSGRTLAQAEEAITTAAVERGLYRAPQVTVAMKKRLTNRVMVVGAVKTPGVYELPKRSSDLVAALVASGGLADNAGAKVEIRNPKRSAPNLPSRVANNEDSEFGTDGHSRVETADLGDGRTAAGHQTAARDIVQVNLVTASREDRVPAGYAVDDGSVVMVEKRTPAPVHVLGLVRRPGKYDFPLTSDVRVLDAVALAGGTSTGVADKVYVIRRLPNEEKPAVIQVSMREAKQNGDVNLRLAEGDVVTVEHTPATVMMEAIQVIRFGVGASLNTLF